MARISLRSWPAQNPRPLRRQHHDAHAGIRGDAVERRLQLADEGARQRVELARPVERQRWRCRRATSTSSERLGAGWSAADMVTSFKLGSGDGRSYV